MIIAISLLWESGSDFNYFYVVHLIVNIHVFILLQGKYIFMHSCLHIFKNLDKVNNDLRGSASGA